VAGTMGRDADVFGNSFPFSFGERSYCRRGYCPNSEALSGSVGRGVSDGLKTRGAARVAPAQHWAAFASDQGGVPEFSPRRKAHSASLIGVGGGLPWAKACFCSHAEPPS
jgi:hypothetical protein